MIRTNDLMKVYQTEEIETTALNAINMEIKEGEFVSIMGASGVGKSTLLHILGTLDRPSSGEIKMDGQDVLGMGEKELTTFRNSTIGFVFQFHYLLAEFSALENVSMPLRIRNMLTEEANEAASAILAGVGLADRMYHRPAQLSGGEQQRVAVARALVHEPDFVLADEPTGNLDSGNERMVIDLLFKELKKRGLGFILVTHDESLAALTARSYLLEEGRLRLLH